MCGVCGFASKQSRFSKDQLDRMVDSMVHRGPDDRGTLFLNTMGLGFRRLAILDQAGGHQPMSCEDGSVHAVVNGEIYNYKGLRASLIAKGHVFHSKSDAEVVPHLYEEGGIEALTHQLRGMFALALIDRKTESLYLVRDHFGIKPLYYTRKSDGLFFASDIQSLFAASVMTPHINDTSLWHYLSFQYVPDPHTMFAGVCKVPPAHYLMYRRGRVELTHYWKMGYDPDPSWTLPNLADAIHDVLKDSVRRHMMSDVPRGAYLSSGIDSSAIVAFLRQKEEVDTFSIGFGEDHGEVNELLQARETAHVLGTRHHEVTVTAQEYRDMLPTIVASQEDPLADPSAPALYFLAREARRHVTVVLSGEGADELFAGYPIYAEPHALKIFDYVPPKARHVLGQMAATLPPQMKGRGFVIRGSQTLQKRYMGNAKIFSEEEKVKLVPWIGDGKPYWTVTEPWYAASHHLDPVSQMQTIDGYTWLPGDILMKADKMSMAHSLELRVPFLDVAVFELARTIPPQFKVGQGTTKLALREALRGELPSTLANRPKLGFPIPIRHWLQPHGYFYDFVREILNPHRAPYFESSAVQSLLSAPKGTIFNQDRKIWTLMIFALWHQEFLDTAKCSSGMFGGTQGGD